MDMEISEEELQRAEAEIGLSLPLALRRHFMNHNGGEPENYVFENAGLQISTIVAETLPLLTSSNRGTAVSAYQNLISTKELAPKSFFPFAVDGGGDYFLIDCDNGKIYFMQSIRYPAIEIIDLQLDLEGFWRSLQHE